MKRKFKCTISYKGSKYHGMQSQKHIGATVSGVIQDALYKMLNQEIAINYASRTDAGVHAFGQVIDFVIDYDITPYKFLAGINHYLKSEDISFLLCEEIDFSFNSRFDARMKTYQYLIYNSRIRNPFFDYTHWHVNYSLNILSIENAAKLFIGKQDFASFRNSGCQAKNTILTISDLKIDILPNSQIRIIIQGKSFLYNMVRNIVGTLIDVGRGVINANDLYNIIEAKNRTKAGKTAPAHGLYLTKVEY